MVKSIIKNEPSEKSCTKYPYIGISDGCVVLFTRQHEGFCLQAGHTGNRIGDQSRTWAEELFDYLTGFIELRNE